MTDSSQCVDPFSKFDLSTSLELCSVIALQQQQPNNQNGKITWAAVAESINSKSSILGKHFTAYECRQQWKLLAYGGTNDDQYIHGDESSDEVRKTSMSKNRHTLP